MDLILIRHAEAVALGQPGIATDFDRPLTPHGEEQARQVGRGLQRKGIVFSRLISSPLLRARQTAELVRQQFPGSTLEIDETEALEPDAKFRELRKVLEEASRDPIALVGHAPHLPEFTAWLISGKRAQIDIPKAGVVRLSCSEIAKGQGVLRWLVPVEWMAGAEA